MSLTDGSRLHFVITSERYKQWDAAREALNKDVVARFGALLKPKAPTQQSIARATAFLESNPQVKQAIERTGMSVRDFVLMTVALEQEMQLASNRGAPPTAADTFAVDTAYTLPAVPPAQIPMPPPSTYTAPPVYTPVPTYEPARPSSDTVPRRDSARAERRLDSTYRRDTARPTPKRADTLAPARDTVPSPRADSSAPTAKPVPGAFSTR